MKQATWCACVCIQLPLFMRIKLLTVEWCDTLAHTPKNHHGLTHTGQENVLQSQQNHLGGVEYT